MRDIDLRLEFVKFRRDGDVAALATIFDQVAPQLLRLARHLARDAESPEDLVQSTFVTAIEARDSFDATRPLEPWLSGILANHVSHARRLAARTPLLHSSVVSGAQADPSDRESSGTRGSDTVDHAIENEVWRCVADAIETLPPLYREVVAPRLLEERAPQEVARALGRSESRVRVQLHRGLELLRRALPRGITTAVAFAWLTRSSLAKTRSHVLSAATQTMAWPGTLSTPTGAWIVSKKVLSSLAALMLVAVGYVLTNHDAPDTPRGDASDSMAPRVAAASPTADLPPAPPPSERTAIPTEMSARPSPEVVAMPASYSRALAGLRGRLLESDRTPLRNTALTLIEIDPNSWLTEIAFPFRAASIDPFVAEARTDSSGRFEFLGVFPRGFHALGIDLGGPRATLRAVDLPLASGEILELGDLVLGPIASVEGRIVDENGEPVADARVRATCLPAIAARLGIERIHESTLLIQHENDRLSVVELPTFLRSALARLPVPTTRTDADGRFALSGVPLGSVTTFVDHHDFVPRAFGPAKLDSRTTPPEERRTHDLGTLELSSGRVVTGRVLDASRKPLARAHVVGATDLGVSATAFTTCESVTDDEGRFRLTAFPEEGRAVLAARSETLAQWAVVTSEDDDVEIVLHESHSHELRVTRADGVAVDSIELRVRGLRGASATGTGWIDATRSLRRERSGVFTLLGLPLGNYRALIHVAPDPNLPLGAFGFDFEISSTSDATMIELPKARRLEVHVREAAAQSAVEHACVAILTTEDEFHDKPLPDGLGSCRAMTRTDVRGIAILEGLALREDQTIHLRVDHPRFGTTQTRVPADTNSIDVVLPTPGSFLGHLRTAGVAPRQRFTAIIDPVRSANDPRDSVALPSFQSSDALGDLRIARLAPGWYEYVITSNMLAQDLGEVAARAAANFHALEPEQIASGSFEIRAGERTEITIEIAPKGASTNASISGRITDGGRPMDVATIQLDPDPMGTPPEVDRDGNYSLDDLPPGKYTIRVMGATRNGDAIGTALRGEEVVELAAGEHRKVDFEFESLPLVVRVRQMGEVVPGAMIYAIPLGAIPEGGSDSDAGPSLPVVGLTDPEGTVRLPLLERGRYEISAVRDDRGFASTQFEFRGDASDPELVLELDPGVTLTATYDVDPRLGELSADCEIVVVPIGKRGPLARTLPIDPQHREIRCEHLPAGEVEIYLQRLTRIASNGYSMSSSRHITMDARSQGFHLTFVPQEP